MKNILNSNRERIVVTVLTMVLVPILTFGQSSSKQPPKGIDNDQLKSALYERIFRTSRLDSVPIYLHAFLKKYPKALDEFKYRPDALYGNIAERMAEEKEWNQYELYRAKMSDAEAGALDYLIAGDLLKSNVALPIAEQLAIRSLQQFEKENKAAISVDIKHDSIPNRNTKIYTYGEMSFLYAELSYLSKHESQGLPYALKASHILGGNKSRAYELYLKLLAKTAEPSIALSAIETHYMAGNVNDDELPAIVASLYYQIHKSSDNFKAYYSSLHGQLDSVTKNRILREKTSTVAPDFKLLNMNGEKVKLSDMKGKTVVIDFWATWCIYCKKGFPGMQKVIEKYKSNDKVVFLFIDTMEDLPNLELKKQIADYLISNKYNFDVLLDTKKFKDYEVVNLFHVDGLPTKFVIDGIGNITFKEVGWSGSEEKLINDLTAMIELTI